MRMLLLIPAVLTALPIPAAAADRQIGVTSFTRIRVEGPFEVEVRTGASPAARASGDAAAIERVDLSQNGETLIVRVGGPGWGERPGARPTGPIRIALATPRLEGVASGAGAEVRVGAMKGIRVDLVLTGAGRLDVARVDADQLVATVVGSGMLATAAGKAARARLMVNGPGAIAAPALIADELVTRVEGAGEVTVSARFTAQVTTTGLGKVTVLGKPKCQVRAPAGGPVACGG